MVVSGGLQSSIMLRVVMVIRLFSIVERKVVVRVCWMLFIVLKCDIMLFRWCFLKYCVGSCSRWLKMLVCYCMLSRVFMCIIIQVCILLIVCCISSNRLKLMVRVLSRLWFLLMMMLLMVYCRKNGLISENIFSVLVSSSIWVSEWYSLVILLSMFSSLICGGVFCFLKLFFGQSFRVILVKFCEIFFRFSWCWLWVGLWSIVLCLLIVLSMMKWLKFQCSMQGSLSLLRLLRLSFIVWVFRLRWWVVWISCLREMFLSDMEKCWCSFIRLVWWLWQLVIIVRQVRLYLVVLVCSISGRWWFRCRVRVLRKVMGCFQSLLVRLQSGFSIYLQRCWVFWRMLVFSSMLFCSGCGWLQVVIVWLLRVICSWYSCLLFWLSFGMLLIMLESLVQEMLVWEIDCILLWYWLNFWYGQVWQWISIVLFGWMKLMDLFGVQSLVCNGVLVGMMFSSGCELLMVCLVLVSMVVVMLFFGVVISKVCLVLFLVRFCFIVLSWWWVFVSWLVWCVESLVSLLWCLVNCCCSDVCLCFRFCRVWCWLSSLVWCCCNWFMEMQFLFISFWQCVVVLLVSVSRCCWLLVWVVRVVSLCCRLVILLVRLLCLLFCRW